MDFAVFAWRFTFLALESIEFPPGKAGNVLRGGFGTVFQRVACRADCPGPRHCATSSVCPYARIFEPVAGLANGPSGLADWPRPFVIRAAPLDGQSIPAGGRFHFDVHVFLRNEPELASFETAFRELGYEGFGATRGKAELQSIGSLDPDASLLEPMLLPLIPAREPVQKLRIDFLTPTELKSGDGLAMLPEFDIVFARARDRVATLSALYGAGPLDLDFRQLGERAQKARMMRHDIRRVEVERRSSRTGQRHSIGGFIGEAEYEGELADFLPILRIAEWTGIGRQTVWGKGAIRCSG